MSSKRELSAELRYTAVDMAKHPVTYDHANMMAHAVGRTGAKPEELRKLALRLKGSEKGRCLDLSCSGAQGWLTLPDDVAMRKRIKAMATNMRRFKTCLVIGIGGSDLGARALRNAIPTDKELIFAGANTDPDELSCIMSCLDLKQTLVNVISKSGDTVEPMTTFFIVRDALIKAVGKRKYAEHVVATTDASSGSLRAMAEREGFDVARAGKRGWAVFRVVRRRTFPACIQALPGPR